MKTVVGEAHKTEDLMKQNLSTKLPRFSDSTPVALVYSHISQKSITHLTTETAGQAKIFKYPIATIWCKSFPPGVKDKETSWDLINTKG